MEAGTGAEAGSDDVGASFTSPPEEDLVRESAVLSGLLEPLVALWDAGDLTPPEFAAAYILLFAQARTPSQWLAGPFSPPLVAPDHPLPVATTPLASLPSIRLTPKHRARIARQLASSRPPSDGGDGDGDGGAGVDGLSCCALFALFRIKGVNAKANQCIVEWALGKRQLDLMKRIPSPYAVLRMQCEGSRVVTALVARKQMERRHAHKDALAFLLHDLDHSFKFHTDPLCFQGQVGFLRCMHRTHMSGVMDAWLEGDAQFVHDYNYCIADMNTFPTHMFQFLVAKMITAHQRRPHALPPPAAVLQHMLDQWDMPPNVRDVAVCVCSDKFDKAWDSPQNLLLYAFFRGCAGMQYT